MINITELENNIVQFSFDGLEKFNALIADEAREQLQKLFYSPNARVIIDLNGIKYIDSSGFGCFLITMKTARNNYGVLKICGLSSEIRALFESLQLHTVFELFDDLESCIESFT